MERAAISAFQPAKEHVDQPTLSTEAKLGGTRRFARLDDEHAQDIARAIIDLYHALGRLLR